MSILPHYDNLIQPFVKLADEKPSHQTMVVIEEDGTRKELSASQLYSDISCFGSNLLRADVKRNDIVVLALNHSHALINAFLGCMYAGAVPSVFPYLAPQMEVASYVGQIVTLADRIEAPVIMTNAKLADSFREMLTGKATRLLVVDDILNAQGDVIDSGWNEFDGESAAFLQFSSGTTGNKKGVTISHRAILSQLSALADANEKLGGEVIVSWLPMHHDMGLIGCLLYAIAGQHRSVLMSPFYWIRQPKVMLEEITRYGGTMSFMPNFAFHHCVTGIRSRDLEGLDLSTMRYWLNGSEPIRPITIQMFNQRFGKYGLDPKTIKGAYGMAENTLAISLTPMGEATRVDWISMEGFQNDRKAIAMEPGANGSVAVAASGLPVSGTEISVIDDDGNPLPERHVGQFRIKGTCLFSGYFKQPELTASAMDEDGWFRTGDMGYIADGYVYVSGRLKDLVIVGGKNIYPKDVEDLANIIPGIRPGRVAVFGVDNERSGSEDLVLVAELRGAPTDDEKLNIMRMIRQSVAGMLAVRIGDVRFVDKGWVIKSSSGKTARPANKAKYILEFKSG